MQQTRPQEDRLAGTQHHEVHQQGYDDTGVARVALGDRPHRRQRVGELVGVRRGERGDEVIDLCLGGTGEQPRDRCAQRCRRNVGCQVLAQRGDAGCRGEGVQHPQRVLDRPQAAQRLETVAEGDDELGLVVLVAVVAGRVTSIHPRLPREADLCLRASRVHLNRQRIGGGEQLEQIRQCAAGHRVEGAAVSDIGGIAGVVAEPHLGFGGSRRRAPLKAGDQSGRPPGVVARFIGDGQQHAPIVGGPRAIA